MARLLVLYTTPADAAAFDAHYTTVHVPLVHAIPGLMKFELSDGPVVSPTGPTGVHLVATLHFADLASLRAGLSSAEGQAAAADAAPLMSPGSSMLIFEDREA